MIIYFEDGRLDNEKIPFLKEKIESGECHIIEAGDGISVCLQTANKLLTMAHSSGTIIYTNCFALFSTRYAWNNKTNCPDIYIRSSITNEFTHIKKLTNRALTQSHILSKMYLAGEFDIKSKRYDAYLSTK